MPEYIKQPWEGSKKILDELKELLQSKGKNDLKIGRLFAEVNGNPKAYGYQSFTEFIDAVGEISPRNAKRYIKKYLLSVNISQALVDRVVPVGASACEKLYSVLVRKGRDVVEKFIETAPVINMSTVQIFYNELMEKNSPGRTRKKCFMFYQDEYIEVVELIERLMIAYDLPNEASVVLNALRELNSSVPVSNEKQEDNIPS